MGSSLGLSGLASGVDTSSIISQLMALERQSLTRYSRRTKQIQAEQTGLKDVQTRLKNLKAAAEALKGTGLWGDKQTVSSSDTTRVEVATPTGIAPPGSIALRVNALATGAQSRFAWSPPASAGSLEIATSGGSLTVSVAASATAAEAAAQINAANAQVYAGVVDGELVLTSRATGAAQARPTLKLDGADQVAASGLDGANASYTIGATTYADKATNTFTLEGTGLQVTLKAPSATEVVVSAGVPALDRQAIKDKVKAFVTAYNDLVGSVRTKLDEKPIRNAASDFDATKGQLFGDSGLNGLLSSLRGMVSSEFTGAGWDTSADSLLDIGISTGKATGSASTADSKMGKLSFDEAAFDKALADPAKVRQLLGGATGFDGVSQAFATFADVQSRTDGVLQARISGGDSEIKRVADQTTVAERRIAAKEARMRVQFAAMEKAMAASQSQQQWLAGQIAGLPTSGA